MRLTPHDSRRRAAGCAGVLLVLAVGTSGCGPDDAAAPSPPPVTATSAPSGPVDPAQESTPPEESTDGLLTRDEARAEYARIRAEFQAKVATAPLDQDASGKEFREAVQMASAAFDDYVRQLASTPWPERAQPYVDEYVAMARTMGRDLYAKWKRARSLAEISEDPEVAADTRELDHVEGSMRVRLGA